MEAEAGAGAGAGAGVAARAAAGAAAAGAFAGMGAGAAASSEYLRAGGSAGDIAQMSPTRDGAAKVHNSPLAARQVLRLVHFSPQPKPFCH